MKKKAGCLIASVIVAIGSFTLLYYRSRPEISMSDTLQTSLGNKYDDYVSLLNKAAHKDTAALLNILKMEVYDGAVLDNHGWILIQLLKRNGDDAFYNALLKLDATQVENVKGYIGAGTDYDTTSIRLINQYPRTSGLLEVIK